MKLIATLIFTLALGAACSQDDPDVAPEAAADVPPEVTQGTDGMTADLTEEPDGEAQPDAGPPSCPTATVEVISFETSDGVVLEADLHTTGETNSPAVVLLHMIPPGHDRTNYPPEFRDQLNEAGFTVLNVDRRGAGGSQGIATEAYQGPNGKLDAAAAIHALSGLECPPDLDRLGIVGASNGTTTALDYTIHAAAHPDSGPVPKALVFLTGGTYTENQNPLTALLESESLQELPILFVYPQDEATWSEGFTGASPQWTHAPYTESGHGTQLFDSAPQSMTDVTQWLNAAL